ncbi:MAG TPA: stage II sporulation protein E [Clostridiales bacterium]|nr:stage II sporulation protein E [Clostridiales bacterium]
MKGRKLKGLLIQVMGVIVARVVIYELNPLAIGYFTALLMTKGSGTLGLMGITIGIATVMPITHILKYLLTMVTTLLFMEIPLLKSKNIPKFIRYIVPSTILFIYSLMDVAAGGIDNWYIILSLLEGIIAIVSAVLFREGLGFILESKKGYKMNNEQMVSMAVLVAVIIYGFPEFSSPYMATVETVIYFIILFFTYKYGVGQGAITGAVCGLSLSLKGGSISDTAMLTMMGIITGTFREMGKVSTAAVYLICAALMGYMNSDMELSIQQIGALVSSVIIFLLLPKKLLYRVDVAGGLSKQEILSAENLKKIAKTKMGVFSDSFLKLSKTLETITEKQGRIQEKEINRMFEDISEKLCKNCSNCSNCWDNNLEETYKATCSLFEVAERNGFIGKEDIPPKFLSDCICVDEFVKETNRSFEIAKLNHLWQSRVAESREVIADQLKGVSSVIKEITNDIYTTNEVPRGEEEKIIKALRSNHIYAKDVTIYERGDKRKEIYLRAACKRGKIFTAKEAGVVIGNALGRPFRVSETSKYVINKNLQSFVFVEDTKFKVLTGVARAMKESVSGDNFSIMKLENGDMMAALADGMGTGKEAGDESETVMSLLEQMIEAGFKAEMAIKLINSSLVLKSDKQTFSTIDLSIVNLFTGICEFIKIGAAATFIKREDWVETITSTTLPIGMFGNVDYDTVTKKLYNGDIIIMVTDGVLDCIPDDDKEGYMEKLIMEINSNNPQEIANRILDKALVMSNYIPKDDMTILITGIWTK